MVLGAQIALALLDCSDLSERPSVFFLLGLLQALVSRLELSSFIVQLIPKLVYLSFFG